VLSKNVQKGLPTPENAARMCATARSLAQILQCEISRLEAGGFATGRVKDIYDQLYLPRLVALAAEADRYLEWPDLALLALPLSRDLAATQLRIVIETMDLLVMAL
jgi:hypothetical protein